MSMPKQSSPTPSYIAACVGIAAAGCVLAFGLLGVVQLESRRLMPIHAGATESLKRMAEETIRTLRLAEYKIKPECTEDSLRSLRRIALASDVIAEIGIRGEGDAILCTTTDGGLSEPYYPDPEDVIAVKDGDFIGTSFNIAIITAANGDRLVSTITSSRHFTVAISPPLIGKLYGSGVTSVRMLKPDSGTISMFQDGSVKPWLGSLPPASIADGDYMEWDWSASSYVISSRVQGTDFITQTVASDNEIVQRYKMVLAIVVVVSLIVGWLSFASVLPWIRRRSELESRLRGLLTPANVICMLQPIVRLDTGELIGCELLMRLNENGDTLLPAEIIPAVLNGDLTDQFDSAVIERAGIELSNLKLPSKFKVAVNFFPDTLRSGLARQLLARHFSGIVHSGVSVAVEVLEEQVNNEISGRVMELVYDGYLVSLDDFGTGYSNLASVRNLAPTFLKVDRSFVHAMKESSIQASLIPQIIQIARAVGAQVVAEGIESAEQARILRDLGAEFGQGYFFGRPMSLDDFSKHLASSLATKVSPNVLPAMLHVVGESKRA